MTQFKDRVVIVTGAGSGVGREIAIGFVNEAAKVAFVGRRRSKLEESATGLPKERVMILPCDVSIRHAVDEMVNAVLRHFGAVDILVNNAGINTSPRSIAEVAPEDWNQIIAINLNGVFNTIRAVLPGMREKKDGLIINISSIAGIRASELAGAAYAASKHGVMALNHTLNIEEKEFGIRACAICPGEIDTPILDQRPQPVSPEHRARILKPKDIAEAVFFVARYPSRVCIPELVIKPTTQIFQ
ncbi:MAG: SDR family oxidoreductase [Deltaproteobacteria bacterium]|nr:SDR family oxidoreductase [Deltaproteobacteria bacterium]MBW1963422.1 SDR family oxidoreductase [Deltaproteobacteria bacterium]MBW1994237.1 SDR family oxidoreductase [Deltaproteobacteria bacterium]MBW2153537.1 SDR family oxidoreductase [Deltaproteobacteria bacterium]